MAKQKKYHVTVAYTFTATFEIKAESEEQASWYAEQHCCAISPEYQSTITSEWTGSVHADKTEIIDIEEV